MDSKALLNDNTVTLSVQYMELLPASHVHQHHTYSLHPVTLL